MHAYMHTYIHILHWLVVIVDGDVHIHVVAHARLVRVGHARRYYCSFRLYVLYVYAFVYMCMCVYVCMCVCNCNIS